MLEGSRIWEAHELMPSTPKLLFPKRIATEAFADASTAVARLADIYERNTGFLRDRFEAYVRGEPFEGRVRAALPFVPLHSGTHPALCSPLASGLRSRPLTARAAV